MPLNFTKDSPQNPNNALFQSAGIAYRALRANGSRRTMPSKVFLRTLIAAEVALCIISVVVSLLTESALPDPLRAFLDAEAKAEMAARDMMLFAAATPLFILLVVSSVGLFFFWRPARILYLIDTVAGLVVAPFFGPYVDAGWGTALGEVATIVSGVILALIYFSPLKDLYEKPKAVPQG